MTTRKGSGVNALGGSNDQLILDTLNYNDSFHTTWDTYCWVADEIPDWPKTPPTEPFINPDWVYCLGYQIPTEYTVRAALSNNPFNRNHWWACGIEPDTAGEGNANPDTGLAWTAEEFADLITQQINAIKDYDVDAKFWIRCGTQGGVNTTYMKDILSHISSAKRNNYIKAVGYHFYPQNTSPWGYQYEASKLGQAVAETWLDAALAKRDECNTLYGLNLQFWIGEAGLAINTDPNSIYKENNSLMQAWPDVFQNACNAKGVNRWYLYGWQDIPNYMNVYHGTTRTTFGTNFKNAA